MKLTAVSVFLFIILGSRSLVSEEADRVTTRQLQSLTLQEMASSASFSPFGNYFALISRDNRVRLYNSDYRELWNYNGAGRHGTAPAISFTADEKYLLFPGFGSDDVIAMADLESGEIVSSLKGHRDTVKALVVSPDGKWLISSASDEVITWRREGETFVLTQQLPLSGLRAQKIAVSPNSTIVACADYEDFIRIYSLGPQGISEMVELRPEQKYGNTGYLTGFDFSPDGKWLVAALRDELTIYSIEGTGAESLFSVSQIISELDSGSCKAIHFGFDSRHFIAGFGASEQSVWTLSDSKGWEHEQTFRDSQDYIVDLSLSPDGKHLATVSVSGNGVVLWAVEGLGRSSRDTIGQLIKSANGGSGLGYGQRTVLTPQLAEELLLSLPEDKLSPRGMFEKMESYESRIGEAAEELLHSLASSIVKEYGGESDGPGIRFPLTERGSYDIDREVYTISLLSSNATLAINPQEAEKLYMNWGNSHILTNGGLARPGSGELVADWLLIHPVSGRSYPLNMNEDPLSGVSLNEGNRVTRSIDLASGLVLEDIIIEPLYPSLYRIYETRPFVTATLKNITDVPLEDISIVTRLAKYSDESLSISTPPVLGGKGEVELLFSLLLGNSIMKNGGEETVSLSIEFKYSRGGKQESLEINLPVTIESRNGIRWDDDKKVAAMVTVVQSPRIMEFSGNAVAAISKEETGALPREFVIAMKLYEDLRSSGIAYRVDPDSSYRELSKGEHAVDFLQFPLETLVYKAGDCDDLSVLYNSLLEAAGVSSAFITTPGHIFTAFKIKISPSAVGRIFPDKSMLIVMDDEYWIPVEVTLLGSGFIEAWESAIRQWRSAEVRGTGCFFTTDDAWKEYPPALWVPEGGSEAVIEDSLEFSSLLRAFREKNAKAIIEGNNLTDPRSVGQFNRRGGIYARMGFFSEAEHDFSAALEIDEYIPALINLAKISSLRGDRISALRLLKKADSISPDNPRILLTMAIEELANGNTGTAFDYYTRASEIDKTIKSKYPLFAGSVVDGGVTRGSDDHLQKIFREEWE